MSNSLPFREDGNESYYNLEITVFLKKTNCWPKIVHGANTVGDPMSVMYFIQYEDHDCSVETIHIHGLRPLDWYPCKKIMLFSGSFYGRKDDFANFDSILENYVPTASYESGLHCTSKDEAPRCLFAKIWPPKGPCFLCIPARNARPESIDWGYFKITPGIYSMPRDW